MQTAIRSATVGRSEKGVITRSKTFEREPRYALAALAGVVFLLVTGVVVHVDDIPPLELPVFRFVNAFPDFIYRPLWAVMQMGNLVALPVFALAALVFRRWRLALGLLIATGAKLELTKLIKANFERHRPATILDDVTRREDFGGGLAFVSGHALVAVAIATLVAPYLGKRGRIAIWTAAGLVCFGRVYVGAHLPLDVIAGAAVGAALGSLLNLALGVPRRREVEFETVTSASEVLRPASTRP